MSMLLFVTHRLWSIFGDSGSVVSSVVSSDPALLSFHMLTGNLDRARQLLNLFPEAWAPTLLAHRSAGVGTPKAEPLLQVVLGLSRASAQPAAYLEPREHGATSSVSHIREAIADVHASAGALAAAFAVGLACVHRAAWSKNVLVTASLIVPEK